MKIVINNNGERIPATLEVVDGVMIVSPDKDKVDISQFKDGDIITCGWDYDNECYSWTCVLRGEIEQIVDNMFIASYCDIDCNGECSCENGDSDSATWVRYATEEEKQKLFDALANEGKTLDAEKKAVVDLKWKPKINEAFYFPLYELGHFIAESDVFFEDEKEWLETDTDVVRGWVFRTKEECEAYCKKLNQAIEGIKP